jgi:hypothetical protein
VRLVRLNCHRKEEYSVIIGWYFTFFAMNSQDSYELEKHLNAAAALIYKNTPSEQLRDFESLEIALREQLQAHVQPTFGDFFGKQYRNNSR